MTAAPDVRAIQRAYPQIYRACHERHTTRSSRDGLSERDGSILAHLDALGAARPTDLARHLGVGRSTLSAALVDLARRGLVEARVAMRDFREREISLTRNGRAAVATASVLDGERLSALLSRMTTAERRQVVRGLEALARAARTDLWNRSRGGEP
jgi:DNA-binding MarR family transcriptional regulator